MPFDSFAVALNELPTPQLAEPEGEFTTFARHELPTAQPPPLVHSRMLKLMVDTAREGYVKFSSYRAETELMSSLLSAEVLLT